MIPVGVACSCLVVSYLCVYATGKGRVRVSVYGTRARDTPTTNTNREQTLFQVFHDIEGS